MKITVTFDSLEEFQEYMKAGAPASAAKKPAEAPKKAGKASKVPADEFMNIPEDKGDDVLPFGDDAKEVSETDVKVLLSEKLKAGKKTQVKAFFAKYGVEKLSDLIEQYPDKLAKIYKEAEGI